jgi:hypothetical protein
LYGSVVWHRAHFFDDGERDVAFVNFEDGGERVEVDAATHRAIAHGVRGRRHVIDRDAVLAYVSNGAGQARVDAANAHARPLCDKFDELVAGEHVALKPVMRAKIRHVILCCGYGVCDGVTHATAMSRFTHLRLDAAVLPDEMRQNHLSRQLARSRPRTRQASAV